MVGGQVQLHSAVRRPCLAWKCVVSERVKLEGSRDHAAALSLVHSFIHLFSVNLITRYGKSHISNSKSYSQLSSMYTWLRDAIVIVQI